MRPLETRVVNILAVLCLVIGTAGRVAAASGITTPAQAADKTREVNVGGHLSVGHGQAPASFIVGYSFFVPPPREAKPLEQSQGDLRPMPAP